MTEGFSGENEKRFKKLKEDQRIEQLEADKEANKNRGRTLSIGTAFGGTVEVSIRMANGQTAWVLLQPVEATEIIHQLAAQIGCHIALKPRKDFGSWRAWDDNLPALGQNTGLGMIGFHPTFSQFPPFEGQDPALLQEGYSKEHLSLLAQGKDISKMNLKQEEAEGAVATKKTVNKRTPKSRKKTS